MPIKVPAKRRTRPTVIRHSLGRAFLEALQDDFREHGPALIGKLRDKSAGDYLKLIVSLLPEELLIEKAIEDMTDEELATALDVLQPLVEAKLVQARGDGPAERD
jgi:hypothetical protein